MGQAKSKDAPRLRDVDLDRKLSKDDYKHRLAKLQRKILTIQQAYMASGESGVVIFEGWDAAGKGGTIRRIASVLDPRSFRVWPIGAPGSHYLDRHYLLRFMERLPPKGSISIFDRSWYGRVLVERVEDLTPERRWRQAYREIVEFERMLVDDGMRIAKVFFHISPDEQLERFEGRLQDPLKRYKLSTEDFRNRARWDDYETAIDEMLQETSTDFAPWHLVASNNKKHGRIAAMEEIVARLADGIDLSPAPLDPRTIEAAGELLDIEPDLMKELNGTAKT